MPVPADQRVAQIAAVRRFRTTPLSFYSTSAVGPQMTATWNSVIVYRFGFPPVSPTFQDVVVGRTNTGAPSGGFWWRITGAGLQVAIVDGVPATIASPSVAPPERGLVALGATYDGANLKLFDFSGQVGADVPSGGGATANLTHDFVVGNRDGTQDRPPSGSVVAYQHSEDAAVLSDSDMIAHLNNIIEDMEQGRALRAFAGCEYYIDAADLWQGPGAPLAAAWVPRIDTIGTGNLAKTGSPEPASYPARF